MAASTSFTPISLCFFESGISSQAYKLVIMLLELFYHLRAVYCFATFDLQNILKSLSGFEYYDVGNHDSLTQL